MYMVKVGDKINARWSWWSFLLHTIWMIIEMSVYRNRSWSGALVTNIREPPNLHNFWVPDWNGGQKNDVCSFTLVNNPTYPYSCTAILTFVHFLFLHCIILLSLLLWYLIVYTSPFQVWLPPTPPADDTDADIYADIYVDIVLDMAYDTSYHISPAELASIAPFRCKLGYLASVALILLLLCTVMKIMMCWD